MTQPLSGAAPSVTADAAATRVVAVAASAGGVEALKVLVAGLPSDLPAALLVALHLPRAAHSMLAKILARVATLPVVVAEHGAVLRAGRIYVCPPDHHLLVHDGRIVLGHGPHENGHRPAHDAMLRAVALEAGPGAVGVVLTGLLDDGAAGLAAVSRYGGICLVQDPVDCEFPSMPRAALAAVPTATSLPLAALAQEVGRVMHEPPAAHAEVDPGQRELDVVEYASAEQGIPVMSDGTTPGAPSPFSCPDCRGVLNLVPDDELMRFRCGTGHAWSSASLAGQQGEQVEEALWTALRVLEERADLSRRLAGEAKQGQRDWSSMQFSRRADEADRSVAVIRRVLEEELAAAGHTLPPAGS